MTTGTTPQVSIAAATTSAAGAMSAADKAKLDGLTGAATSHATTRPTSPASGSIFFNLSTKNIEVWDGTVWQLYRRQPVSSCKDLRNAGVTTNGIYTIDLGINRATDVYCDMTTEQGGWTLVSYGYRSSRTTDVYYQPNGFRGTWDASVRNSIASIDASTILRSSTEAALTVTSGGSAVTGNMLAYATAHVWTLQTPSNLNFDLTDNSSCVTISVRELKANSTFNAQQQQNRVQVSCSGHKGGTSFERTMIGFNSSTCFGVCGADPTTSMGMVVWRGDGYCPTTSGGSGCPERAGSFALWFR